MKLSVRRSATLGVGNHTGSRASGREVMQGGFSELGFRAVGELASDPDDASHRTGFRRVWIVLLGGLAWGVLLLAMGLVSVGEVPFASLVGGANFAIGVLVHRLVAWPWRALRPDNDEPSSVGV